MIIDEKLCVGCGACIPYCPTQAIHFVSHTHDRAFIDQNKCVYCGVCKRVTVCPTNAIISEKAEWPRSLSQFLSDPTITKKETGVPGRGTEESKTNDVTGRFKRGQLGICVELGRPELGTTMKDVEKMCMALARIGVEFEEKNPVTYLMVDKVSGKIRDDILNVSVHSCVIECKFKINKIKDVIETLKTAAKQIDTVFSVGLISRIDTDGNIPVITILRKLRVPTYPNAKINLGLGKPLVDD